jgi:serine/threonine protein kinase
VAKLLQIIRSVARGMLHLHTRRPPLLHRDLKPANIFVGHGLVMKIGDFGMSRNVALGLPPAPGSPLAAPGTPGSLARTLTPGVVGTVAYAAPEVLDESLQQPDAPGERLLKADVYSFGVTVWEVLERRRPHEGLDTFQMTALWMSDPEAMALPPVAIPEGCAPREKQVFVALQELVGACTAFDPDARPTFKAVLTKLKQLQALAMGADAEAPAREGADLLV